MKEILRTGAFKKWFKKLKDVIGKALITRRIDRLSEGNPGDWGPVGDGLFEMRIHYGPGYRVYFKDTGTEIIVLLCGGGKSTQKADIAKAKELANTPLKEEEEEKDGNSR
jgi:putative addiction module killer protein